MAEQFILESVLQTYESLLATTKNKKAIPQLTQERDWLKQLKTDDMAAALRVYEQYAHAVYGHKNAESTFTKWIELQRAKEHKHENS
jgi:hypothetical protein